MEQQLHLFQRVSRFMAREMTLAEMLQSTVNLIVEFMRSDACLLYLFDHDDLVLCSSSNPTDSIGRIRLKLGEGLTGWVARERRFVAISSEAYKDHRFKNFSELPEDSFEAFLSAPVIARNRVVGVINVQHRAPHSYSGEEMETLATAGELIGSLLVMSRVDSKALDSGNHADLVLSALPQPALSQRS